MAAATRRELGIPEGCTLLLYVGRLAAEKNTRVLFEAFEILTHAAAGRIPSFRHRRWRAARRFCKTLQAKTQAVTWLPYCGDTAQLARFYRAADLFVHPGVQETFGLVALESQACGTPVVGIAGSYMDRIIFNDQHDWARENSGPALAQAILEATDANLAGQRGAGQQRGARALFLDACF